MLLSSGSVSGIDDGREGERHRSAPECLGRWRAADPIRRRIDADDGRPALADGPLGGDDEVAAAARERCPQGACPPSPGKLRSSSTAPADERLDIFGRGVHGARRAEGQQVVGQAAEGRGAGRTAEDDQAAAEPQPGAQRSQLLGLELRRVDVLPDESIDGRPGLDPGGQVGRRQGHDRGRCDPGISEGGIDGRDQRSGSSATTPMTD